MPVEGGADLEAVADAPDDLLSHGLVCSGPVAVEFVKRVQRLCVWVEPLEPGARRRLRYEAEHNLRALEGDPRFKRELRCKLYARSDYGERTPSHGRAGGG